MVQHETSILPLLLIGGQKSWQTPELTAVNTLPPHALTIPFPASGVPEADPSRSPWFQSLNGLWDFKLLPRPEAATSEAAAADGWAPLAVPGNWTMQGFG